MAVGPERNARAARVVERIAYHGIVGMIVARPSDFKAHAWLTAGDRVVTGGNFSGYGPLVRP